MFIERITSFLKNSVRRSENETQNKSNNNLHLDPGMNCYTYYYLQNQINNPEKYKQIYRKYFLPTMHQDSELRNALHF